MKKYFKTIVKYSFIFGLFVSSVSCEDYLDRSPDTVISETEAFENFTKFQGFTEELYQCIPDFTNAYWTNSWNWGEDEIQSTARDFHFVVKIDNGNLWGWQSEYDGWQAGWMNRRNVSTNNDRFAKDLWTLGWAGIRKANIGLANIENL